MSQYLFTNVANVLSIILKKKKCNENKNILLKLKKSIYNFNQKRIYKLSKNLKHICFLIFDEILVNGSYSKLLKIL